MRAQPARSRLIGDPNSPTSAGPRGRRLLLIRVVWVAVAALAVGLFVAAVPIAFAQLQTVCTSALCPDRQPTPDATRSLQELGLSLRFYAAYFTAFNVGTTAVWWMVGALIFWRRSDDPMALFVSLLLVAWGASIYGSPTGALAAEYPALRLPVEFIYFLGQASFSLLFYLFPDGHWVPRRARWAALAWVMLAGANAFFPGSPFDLNAWPDWLNVGVLLILTGTLVYAQVYRYRRVSGSVERQQTKWVVFGLTASVLGFAGLMVAALVLQAPTQVGSLFDLVGSGAIYLFFLPVPLSIGISILRYRLFDIDVIINRALVYGALTVGVVGLYMLVVGGLSALLEAQGNLLISLFAAGLVAIIFAPLRDRLQCVVNRLTYGERDDPYGVVSRLGRRLEATLAPEAVLPAIVENVARALRLPRAGIWLADGETLRLEAAHGSAPADKIVRDAGAVEALRHAPDGLGPGDLSPGGYRDTLFASGTPLVLPLTHRGEFVGALSLAPRGPEEEFSPADRRLLRDLATQSGAAVHAVRLTSALRSSLEQLRRSRERLISAQEEERRRIQRDLHDGLGPTLASMRLRLEACLDAAQETEAPLVGDLERLYELIGQATGDIRRLVYDLRPPVLDQLGLVPALRQHCERFGRETGIEVRFEVGAELSIPAVAEVTLLRVMQEALVNVQKHAQASRAEVRLGQRGEWLMLEIRDDGVGFDTDVHGAQAGTGMGSMRERAELLGGTLQLTGRPGAGTEVVVRVPNQEVAR